MNVKCAECGREVEAFRKTRRFCGNRCRGAAKRRRPEDRARRRAYLARPSGRPCAAPSCPRQSRNGHALCKGHEDRKRRVGSVSARRCLRCGRVDDQAGAELRRGSYLCIRCYAEDAEIAERVEAGEPARSVARSFETTPKSVWNRARRWRLRAKE